MKNQAQVIANGMYYGGGSYLRDVLHTVLILLLGPVSDIPEAILPVSSTLQVLAKHVNSCNHRLKYDSTEHLVVPYLYVVLL